MINNDYITFLKNFLRAIFEIHIDFFNDHIYFHYLIAHTKY